MRFILGLIAGAVTTMLVATTLDTPGSELVQTLRDGWQRMSNVVDSKIAPIDTTAKHSKPAQLPLATQQTVDTLDIDAQPAAQPATPPPIDDTVFEPLPDNSDLDMTLLETVPSRSTANQPADGEVVVWSPFHSEASAAGFANRLTRQLSHPFEVRKLGPANYIVIYSYEDPAQQQAIEQRIAEITGVSAS